MKNIGPIPPFRTIRRLSGLSRGQLSAALGFSESSIKRWETGIHYNAMAAHTAWLMYLAYFRPDPVHGWLKCAIGIPPNGQIPSDLLSKLPSAGPGFVRVPGYVRRGRKPAVEAHRAA